MGYYITKIIGLEELTILLQSYLEWIIQIQVPGTIINSLMVHIIHEASLPCITIRTTQK
jgi:hypothetical protein